MKRILPTLVVFLALLYSPAQAQQWEGGLKVGGASTTFAGDLAAGETTWNRRLGMTAGGSVGYRLRFGLMPVAEMTYVRMGASTSVRFLGVPATMQNDLTYLTGALFLQYRLYSGRYINPRIFAGPALSYRLNALITVAAENELGVLAEQDDSVEETDFGYILGGALDIELMAQVLTLEVRYYVGQRDISKPNPELGESDLRNTGIMIMAGILF